MSRFCQRPEIAFRGSKHVRELPVSGPIKDTHAAHLATEENKFSIEFCLRWGIVLVTP
jgi:hypothetical protein